VFAPAFSSPSLCWLNSKLDQLLDPLCGGVVVVPSAGGVVPSAGGVVVVSAGGVVVVSAGGVAGVSVAGGAVVPDGSGGLDVAGGGVVSDGFLALSPQAASPSTIKPEKTQGSTRMFFAPS
jgi:hypothetical protein